ncbi:hypothetical protein XELAEV_18015942mg [Xenopus laevis]|uniref:Uncharacterized protein n=1 Tax=Xenopus laevis TaxID=8355 RepID=A0A974DKX0_XENLA|nr:hypothetical protein XELAEV_18015942mg [Xenopus laevis]
MSPLHPDSKEARELLLLSACFWNSYRYKSTFAVLLSQSHCQKHIFCLYSKHKARRTLTHPCALCAQLGALSHIRAHSADCQTLS